MIVRCPDKLKLIRNYITLAIDERGISLHRLCGHVKYNWYHSRVYSYDYIDLNVINDILRLYLLKYKLILINNEIHKVFQSKMNKI